MDKIHYSSENQTWCTPQSFFDELSKRHGPFTLDAAATYKSAKCPAYFTPAEDGLKQPWKGHTVFCNPPYGRDVDRWVEKAYCESRDPGTKVVMLIAARPDTRRFHKYIFPHASEIEWVQGRIAFTDEDGSPILDKKGKPQPAPFPSCVVVFD